MGSDLDGIVKSENLTPSHKARKGNLLILKGYSLYGSGGENVNNKNYQINITLKLILWEGYEVGPEVGLCVFQTQLLPEAVPVKLNGPFGGTH